MHLFKLTDEQLAQILYYFSG